MYKGDSIYITKTDVFKFEDGQITQQEWIDLVESDDSLIWVEDLPSDKSFNSGGVKIPEKTNALWFSELDKKEADLLFYLWSDNRFMFGFGTDADCLRKILEIGTKLGGFVQTDMGYILSEDDALYLEAEGYED